MIADVVFLLDVDNTLLDGERMVAELHDRLQREFGLDNTQRYWTLFDALYEELNFVDYLGALQCFRLDVELDSAEEQRLLLMSSFLIDYPFADQLYARALEVITHLSLFGQTVLLTDGDVVLQPHRLQRSGLWQAVKGQALICAHKGQMLDAIQSHYPAHHYVMVDDKLRILTAMKAIWQERLTTIFVRQGHYALDPAVVAIYPAADFTFQRIGDLADLDVLALIKRTASYRSIPGPASSGFTRTRS